MVPKDRTITTETRKEGAPECLTLVHEYPPVGGGGAYVAQRLCRAMYDLGCHLEVVTGGFAGLQNRTREEGISLRRIPALRSSLNQGSLLNMGMFFLSSLLSLVVRLKDKRRRPSVIHAHFMYPSGLTAFLVKKIYSIPYVITFHGGDIPGNDPAMDGFFRLLKPLTKAIMSNASELVSVSANSLPLIRQAGGENVRCIPNGTTVDGICRELAEGRKLEILFVGRLVELKRVDVLIKAVAMLPNDLSWHLTICGQGPLEAELKQLAIELGVDDGVTFAGWVGQDEIAVKYTKADVFVLPSSSEGLSMSALEAMGKGAALVLSDIPGNRELVEDGVNGFLCPGEAKPFSEAIVRCAKRLPDLSAGALRIAARHDWKKIAETYLGLFPSANG